MRVTTSPTFMPFIPSFDPMHGDKFGYNNRPTVVTSAGAWFYKQPATIDGIVYDERRGLGTARPVQPRRAMLFNGTNQYVVHTLPSPIAAYPFTLFGWGEKTDSSVEYAVCIGSSSSAVKYFAIGFDEGDRVSVIRSNTTALTNTINIAAYSGWFSFVAVFDSPTTVKIYRNGLLVADLSGLTAASPDSFFTEFVIGSRRALSPLDHWSGYAQHCGYTRTAATLADALAFHETGIMPNAERLFLLDDNSTTVARDIITGAEATIVNGAAGMLYTGRDVPFSRQNDVGYSERRNLAVNTEEFNNWVMTGTTVAPNVVANPYGHITADALFEVNAASWPRITYPVSATAGVTHSWVVYAKANGRDQIRIVTDGDGAKSTYFTLTGNGSVTTGISSTGTIELIGDGWYKCVHTVTPIAGSSYIATASGGTTIASGDSTKGVYLFGAGIYQTATDYQRIGTDPGSSVLFPAILNGTTSAAGDTLQFSGPVQMNGQVQQSNCFTFDGTDDYIAMDLNAVAGPEQIAPLNFQATWAAVNATATSANSFTMTSAPGGLVHPSLLTVGKYYKFECDFTANISAVVELRNGNSSASPLIATSTGTSGTLVGIYYTSSTNLYLRIANTTAQVNVTRLSVKELPSPLVEKLGLEFISNGGFNSDITGWTLGVDSGGTIAWNAGSVRVTRTSTFASASQSLPVVAGRSYLITCQATFVSGTGRGQISINSGASVNTTTLGFAQTNVGASRNLSFVYTPVTTGTQWIHAGVATAASVYDFDNISVRELSQIDSDGTSILTYRSQGDGFTGTAEQRTTSVSET
jgi:hypothetical protein